MVHDALLAGHGHQLLAGAIALVGVALVTGIAYVFQPAVAAFRRPKTKESYTFQKEPK